RDVIEHLGCQPTGDAHFFDFLRGLDSNAHALMSAARGWGAKDKGSHYLGQLARSPVDSRPDRRESDWHHSTRIEILLLLMVLSPGFAGLRQRNFKARQF
ncbi:MAG: hypothetical protein KA507_02120, partial [Candidatus Accumulibacter sp.]|nr:hypothetical protein [Accumulibacter sp.]